MPLLTVRKKEVLLVRTKKHHGNQKEKKSAFFPSNCINFLQDLPPLELPTISKFAWPDFINSWRSLKVQKLISPFHFMLMVVCVKFSQIDILCYQTSNKPRKLNEEAWIHPRTPWEWFMVQRSLQNRDLGVQPSLKALLIADKEVKTKLKMFATIYVLKIELLSLKTENQTFAIV